MENKESWLQGTLTTDISNNSTSVIVIESSSLLYFPSLTLKPTEKLFKAPSLIKV